MRKEDIFIGNIKKCTKHDMDSFLEVGGISVGSTTIESEIYEENVILIKLDEYAYLPINDITSIISYYIMARDYKINKLNSKYPLFILGPNYVGDIFIDTKSLRPYYKEEISKESTSIRSLKKELRTR